MSLLFRLKRLLKSDRPTTLYSFTSPGQAVSWPRVYDSFSKEGFQKNVIVYRCISMIAHAVGSLEWNLYKRVSAKKKEEIEDHPLLDLLYSPNPLLSKATFFETLAAFRLISGNSYISKVGPGGNTPPKELWPMLPNLMKIAAGERGIPQGYLYGQADKITKYPVDQITGQSDILHMKFFHPTDPWYGMSPIEAAALGIDLHNEVSLWNVSLLKNDARPAGALVVSSSTSNPGGALNDDQFRRIKEEIEYKYSGSKNAGRMAVLEGGLDWKQLSLSPKDMDWVNSKDTSSRDIAIAFGIPTMLVGIKGENTYANYAEARQAFYEDTVIPHAKNIADSLNKWLVPSYGDKLQLDLDKDEIDALAPKRDAMWDRIDKSTILTTNEKREALGYEPNEDGDNIIVSNMMTTLESLVDQAENPPEASPVTPNEDDDGDEEGDEPADTDDDAQDETDPTNSDSGKSSRSVKLFNLTTSKDKQSEWKRQLNMKAVHQMKMKKDVASQFRIEGARVVHALQGAKGPDHAIEIAKKEIESHKQTWKAILDKNSTAVGKAFGQRVLKSLKGLDSGFETKSSETADTTFDKYLSDWVKKNTGLKITGLEDTTKDRVIGKIRKAYEDSLEAGEGTVSFADGIRDEVEGLYDGFSKSRSTTIARTEISAASQAASQGAAEALDLPGVTKEWVATNDDRTRDDHAEMNGEEVDLDENFDVNGNEMNHPGDPDGPPEEVINCRCVQIYHRKGSDE